MNDAEWFDGDDPNLRRLFGHLLRAHVAYQDGRHSEAPTLVFADADYEIGDGACGLHEDGKRANEPAIVYARADALMHMQAENAKLREALEWRPIETAPKNTHIFCGHAEKKWVRFGICYAEAADRWYYSGTSERSQYSQVEGDAPTHWMPMPTPPRAALGKEG